MMLFKLSKNKDWIDKRAEKEKNFYRRGWDSNSRVQSTLD